MNLTEDYVSFEIAKLLKEKGFDIPCRQAYFNGSLVDYTMYGFCDGELLDCPSQSLALKWLREVHNIFIEINVSIDLNGIYHYAYSILDKECKYLKRFIGYYSNHESCIEAALKYTLENLI